MAVRYIGSKARLADAILDIIGAPNGPDGRFVDVFCGTGVVSCKAAELGWNVWANDSLLSSVLMTKASLFAKDCLDFSAFGNYENAVSLLNGLKETQGFIWQQYSPASKYFCEVERRYFTEPNAAKIDSIRLQIRKWYTDGLIGANESDLLIADLIGSANAVANIAGTYGCFLKKWTKQAERTLNIVPRTLAEHSLNLLFTTSDALQLEADPLDVAYLDPPYTKRQYSSYYHIPETIAYYDEPSVHGVAGLRPWKSLASPFCYKNKALASIINCIDNLGSKTVYLSYSSQGHVSLDDLVIGLAYLGKVTVHELGEIGRYRPNSEAVKSGSSVCEYLIQLDRSGRGLSKNDSSSHS